jgi:hypothetical protein
MARKQIYFGERIGEPCKRGIGKRARWFVLVRYHMKEERPIVRVYRDGYGVPVSQEVIGWETRYDWTTKEEPCSPPSNKR